MGRRKIEIQPITHERNRSVTFLKRKNGLFKKAYELGVLCSVDVAVIIFEERPGHHVKLYQYCSGNIDDVVQRHSRFDGEKDTRTPHDFANHPNVKHDDIDEGADEVEDEDSEPVMGRDNGEVARMGDTGAQIESGIKLRQSGMNSSDLPMHNLDHLVHRTTGLPITTLSADNALMPTSGERLSTSRSSSSGIQNGVSSKRPRLAPSMSSDRMSQEDTGPPVSRARFSYHPTSAPPSYQFPAYVSSLNSQQSIPPAHGFDFPSRNQFRPMNTPSRSMSAYNQLPDTRNFMRLPAQQYHQQQQHSQSQMTSSHQQQQPQQGDIFAGFLDGDQKQQAGPGFGSIDWPVHTPPQAQGGRPEQGDLNDPSWLDFLSSHPPASSTSLETSASLPSSGRDIVSWQRDRPSAVNGTITLEPASRSPSLAASPRTKSKKRSRSELVMDGRSGNQYQEDDMKQPISEYNSSTTPRYGKGKIDRDSNGEDE